MGLYLRKICVWLVSLGIVLAAYLLLNRLSGTPRIDIEPEAEFTEIAADSNVGGPDGKIGMIGDVGVGTVQKAKYTHLNKQRQVDREFGFEKLLHDMGSRWEIEKPFMTIYQRDLKCHITADKGMVQVETALGRPSPKDATLLGNVVIHILPENDTDVKESFIYLDDIVFISDQSQFSTAGPVKFVSRDAQMLGKGLELVYNDELDRLEYLRIAHLDSLHLKPSSGTSSSTGTEVQTGHKPEAAEADAKPASTKSRQAESYRCTFSKNVVVDCPEQLILADELTISNIVSDKGSGKADAADSDNAPGRIAAGPAEKAKPDKSPQPAGDIVVTCDNGIVVTPMSATLKHRSFAHLDIKETVTGGRGLERFDNIRERATFVARRIDYSLADDELILEGDCSCTMLQKSSETRQKYTLSAPRIMVGVSRDKAEQGPVPGADIRHLTADGGLVRLAVIKTAEQSPGRAAGELLSGIELKCFRFDYDADQQMFLAAGPGGIIKVDNSGIAATREDLNKFSLKRPCYAFVRNFQTLKYSLKTGRIAADAGYEGIFIDYIPVIRGQYGQQTAATANHIDALLYETADGRTELSRLSAGGGVTYEEEQDNNKSRYINERAVQFIGSEFLYDAGSSRIRAWGDGSGPCLLNGTVVDGIEYNLKTGRANAKITGPGALQN